MVKGPLEGTKTNTNLFSHLKTTQTKKNKVDPPIAAKKKQDSPARINLCL